MRILHDGTALGEHTLDVNLRTLQSLPVSGGGRVYRIEILETTPGSRTDALANTLTDAEHESAQDLARVIAMLDICQRTCGWPAP